ncbi:hypothetical protein ACQ4M3_08455 [Leptolyngbya sp. AN03gr2]|uniref:hypothetical protein n=1 Tax=unclassified Leptolyngbya TaxID=2650499 RepID=UPI003D311B22
MSETTSFLGGAALAGLAAVILLRGGVGSTNTPMLSPAQPLPNYGYSVQPGVPVPTAPPTTTGIDTDKQRAETEQLRALVEQQRIQTEQLKTQLQSQQALIETLNAQNKAALANPQKPANSSIENNPVFSNLLWMLGGVILTFGGGIALVGMFVLFAKQQRPSRTIEVVHDEYPGYLSNRRRTQVLPARRSIRRVEAEEID